jgi:hypothetical protein
MRLTLVFLMLLAGGCSSQFKGEWLEEAAANGARVNGEHFMALKFEDPAIIRYGLYSTDARAVDAESVQSDTFFLFDGWRKAQFGAMIARIDGNHLITSNGDDVRRFVKIQGRSIFPPDIKFPDLTQSQGVPTARYASISP